MRFEIKTGGWILILIGLAGLSMVVFALGLFAGYDMARSTTPEAPQAASVYPLPNPPPAPEVAKAPAKSSDEVASTQAAKTKPLKAGGPLAMDKNAGPITPSRSNAAVLVTAPKVASDTATDADHRVTKPAVTNSAAKYASASDSSGSHHKPFNIQIDAAMDRNNAQQMTARLQKLGYRAFMVPTDIAGQTWWRVRVGPYPSQEEASAAEQELRERYKDTYAP
jgi:cell division septation protein DedD